MACNCKPYHSCIFGKKVILDRASRGIDFDEIDATEDIEIYQFSRISNEVALNASGS